MDVSNSDVDRIQTDSDVLIAKFPFQGPPSITSSLVLRNIFSFFLMGFLITWISLALVLEWQKYLLAFSWFNFPLISDIYIYLGQQLNMSFIEFASKNNPFLQIFFIASKKGGFLNQFVRPARIRPVCTWTISESSVSFER